MDIGMGILWSGLIGAPVAGFLLNSFWQGERRTALIAAVSALALIGLASVAGLRFASPLHNLSALVLGYTAYAFLTVDGWGINHKRYILRVLVRSLTALPLIFGYFLASVGLLGFLFLFSDFTGEPSHAETLAPGLAVRYVAMTAGLPTALSMSLYIGNLLPFTLGTLSPKRRGRLRL